MALAVAASLLVTACQSAVQPTSSPTSTSRTTTSTTAPLVASSATPASRDPLLGCPTSQSFGLLSVFARTDISPDDILAASDGTLWVTDPDNGYIEELAADGHRLLRVADAQAPEGMVQVGGTIVLAEQRPNRLVSFTPPTTTRTALLSLPPRGAQDGVDGIGLDSANRRILIPDSPHGTLLSKPLNGTTLTTLATGLGRAVDAAVGGDGAIWVAVEGNRGLLRVPAGGGPTTAEGGPEVTQLDDIVATQGLLYATSLTTHDLIAIDPSNGATRVLVTGIASAQGLALLNSGRLAVTDSTSRVIATLMPCAPS